MKQSHSDGSARMVVVGQYVVSLREYGSTSAPAALLVHGIGVSGAYFLPLAEELAKTHRVVVVDLPGYGRTPKPPLVLDIPTLAGVVAEVIELLQLDNPLLIGHSMGCQIIAELCRYRPQLVGQVVLIGPTVNKAERHLPIQMLRLLQDSLHEPARVNKIIFRDYLGMGLRRYLTTCRSMLRDKIEDSLARIEVGVLIVRGEKDKIVSREWADTLVNISPQAELAQVPGAAHVAHCTHAPQVAMLCRQLAALRPRA